MVDPRSLVPNSIVGEDFVNFVKINRIPIRQDDPEIFESVPAMAILQIPESARIFYFHRFQHVLKTLLVLLTTSPMHFCFRHRSLLGFGDERNHRRNDEQWPFCQDELRHLDVVLRKETKTHVGCRLGDE